MIYLEACAYPEMAEDGTMSCVTGLLTDVSIHKAYQREQAEKLENALEAKRTQENFMGKFISLYYFIIFARVKPPNHLCTSIYYPSWSLSLAVHRTLEPHLLTRNRHGQP